MRSVFTVLENSIGVVLMVIVGLSPFVLAVAAIDAITKKPKGNLSSNSLPTNLRQRVRTLAVLATTETRTHPILDALFLCPGAFIAVVGYLCVVGPWVPAIFTLPRGTGIRPMGWAVMAWLICAGITYVGTPIAALDILRGLFSVRRTPAHRVLGIALGVAGVAAGLYASHWPEDVLNGMAAWRGWVIEE